MRSHKSFPLLLGLVIVSFFAVVWTGCSDDETAPTAGSSLGDLNDPDYLIVREQVATFVDSTLDFIKAGFTSMSMLPTDSLVDPVNYGPIDPHHDSASSIYADGWHVVFISRQLESFSTAMRDSIQFRDADGIPQASSDGMTSMAYRHSWTYNVVDTAANFSNCEGDLGVEMTGLNTTQALINGTNQYSVHSRVYSSDPDLWPDQVRDATVNIALDDIRINQSSYGWAHACPYSGTCVGTVELVTQVGEADPVTTNWTYSLTFDEGAMTCTIRRGSTYWTSTCDVCQIPL